jgi:hypothetical protein
VMELVWVVVVLHLEQVPAQLTEHGSWESSWWSRYWYNYLGTKVGFRCDSGSWGPGEPRSRHSATLGGAVVGAAPRKDFFVVVQKLALVGAGVPGYR